MCPGSRPLGRTSGWRKRERMTCRHTVHQSDRACKLSASSLRQPQDSGHHRTRKPLHSTEPPIHGSRTATYTQHKR
eukprot:857372-Rhodomonas_salina.1